MFFFNDTMSIYTIAIGSLFNNLKVQRINKTKDPVEIKEIDVPLNYYNKMHWYYKTYKTFPDKTNINKVLPRMAFSLDNLNPDNDRQTNKFETLKFEGDISRDVRDWCQTAVPYKFGFTLSIYTKFQTELNQLMEQVLPFFPAKSRDLHIKEVPILNIYRSVKVELTGLSPQINVDYSDNGHRVIQFDMNFDLDGYLYPPIKEQKIIKYVDFNLYLSIVSGNYQNEQEIVITEHDTENEG